MFLATGSFCHKVLFRNYYDVAFELRSWYTKNMYVSICINTELCGTFSAEYSVQATQLTSDSTTDLFLYLLLLRIL